MGDLLGSLATAPREVEFDSQHRDLIRQQQSLQQLLGPPPPLTDKGVMLVYAHVTRTLGIGNSSVS